MSESSLKALGSISQLVNNLIVFGAGLCATVFVMRLTGIKKFKFSQLELPLDKFPYVAFALTAAHIYLTAIFVQRTCTILKGGKELSSKAWEQLTDQSGIVFLQMAPRRWDPSAGLGGAYVASASDLAFWLTLVFSIGLIAAIAITVASDRLLKFGFIGLARIEIIYWFRHFALGCTFAGVNWIIGSQWAISASALAIGETTPRMFCQP